MMRFNSALSEILPSASMKIGLNDVDASYTNFAIGAPDIDPPQEVIDIIRERASIARHPYTPTIGSALARRNIATILSDSTTEVSSDNVVLCEGAKYGIYLALNAICSAGDSVMMLEPYWLSYPNMTAALRLKNVFFQPTLSGGRLHYDFDSMARQAVAEKVRAIIINNPNNPSGQIIESDDLVALASVLRKYGIWLLIDEVYKDLVYDSTWVGTFNIPGSNVIRVGSFSKNLCVPGLRVGYLVGEKDALKQIVLLGQHIETCPNTYALAVAESINVQTIRLHAGKCSKIYSDRFDALVECLENSRIKLLKSDSSFYAFADFAAIAPSGLDACALLADKHKILATPGHEYGESFKTFVRICLTIPRDQIVLKFKEVINADV